jgi:hypothetical protein
MPRRPCPDGGQDVLAMRPPRHMRVMRGCELPATRDTRTSIGGGPRYAGVRCLSALGVHGREAAMRSEVCKHGLVGDMKGQRLREKVGWVDPAMAEMTGQRELVRIWMEFDQ